ncbi:metallophosphoesterase [Phycisphaera mikurensis]|uniref:Putative hydrolase n=1 Tax=Phycisphaera mikurensis (strain NBRC 102666 / KCTC 22515 / FYK2301M01) TaxID=1142394 RepID=I0IGF5_PHYMF|nr:metallophosphoesterase [Phycisphaera mikurensis]MBB6442974.1 hypothetical protein [Phycisphaera mikurensis]BAM04343.1 putative hydrolase [Phycisphaera mikurensis NBRC 102666]
MPVFVIAILSAVLGCSALWWLLADRLVAGRRARLAVAAYGMFQLVLVFGVLAARAAGFTLPAWAHGFALAWTLILLAPAVFLLAVALALRGLRGRGETPEPGRRALLGAVVAGPPVLAAVGTAVGLVQSRGFVARERELAVPGLPPALEGLRVVHVSDTHVGAFTRGPVLDRIAAAVNGFGADLVCFTGDLVNAEHEDIAAGCKLLSACRSRHGVFAVEGNHDLFEGAYAFRREVRGRGVDLLVDEGRALTIRGVPVDLLGLRWAADRELDDAFEATVRGFARRPGAFCICLAHHPHAFDTAAAAGVPLTLTGHTHGGQLMLPGGVGPGPLMYRYWSGVYEKTEPAPGALAVVSNGSGNWFPLRTFAPAEVVCLVLRARGPAGHRASLVPGPGRGSNARGRATASGSPDLSPRTVL